MAPLVLGLNALKLAKLHNYSRIMFKRIITSWSTEQVSGVSYVITLLNCLFYTWYEFPFLSSDSLLISIISSIGVVIEFVHVPIFITYASKKESAKIMRLPGLALILFITFAFVSLFILHGKTCKLSRSITLDISSTIMTKFKRIIRNRSTEQFSGVPYVVTLLSYSLYTWYGLPFVSSDNLLLLIISAMGVVIELTYVLIFIAYAPKKERAKIMGFSGLALIFFLTFAFASLFALHSKNRKLLCSIRLDIFSTIMCASPLSVMMMVIKTESVKFMPFLLSLSTLCGIFWLAYGLLSHDPFLIFRKIYVMVLQVPNELGTGLGIAQLIL
ncbi:bidirectional sugar transporter SWEET1-like [Eucalyptus grandis]|uniref:bidirectional sugar transporter SWEET1-like n=1 Tax=Eucalyptus grandis TaxID=71139 RepID=UPI00192ED41B|nr:bidirectional sugar transporter SWEET1-like [Eucalyptus grandis]